MGLCSRMQSVKARERMFKQFWNMGKIQKILKGIKSSTKAAIFLLKKKAPRPKLAITSSNLTVWTQQQ